MKVVKCKDAELFNMSVSMLFGKSPKCNIQCGNCEYWFSKRFDIINGKLEAIGMCPYCDAINTVPIELEN